MSQESKIGKIINQGTVFFTSENPSVSENQLNIAIDALLKCAREEPGVLLTELFHNKDGYMTCFGLAVLSSAGPMEFLQDQNIKSAAISILEDKNPIQLLEFIEYLKSKIFGRGFGSRPQKWVRTIMEGWSKSTLEKYISSCPNEVYNLIRLVHPRWRGKRGEIISKFLKKDLMH